MEIVRTFKISLFNPDNVPISLQYPCITPIVSLLTSECQFGDFYDGGLRSRGVSWVTSAPWFRILWSSWMGYQGAITHYKSFEMPALILSLNFNELGRSPSIRNVGQFLRSTTRVTHFLLHLTLQQFGTLGEALHRTPKPYIPKNIYIYTYIQKFPFSSPLSL